MQRIDMNIRFDINRNKNKAHPVGRHDEAKNKVKFLPHITPSPEIPAAKITAFMMYTPLIFNKNQRKINTNINYHLRTKLI
ncbi:MAG: hypothetical protein ACP5QY_09565, partial [Candidatus Hydrogenedens sp.]